MDKRIHSTQKNHQCEEKYKERKKKKCIKIKLLSWMEFL